MGLFDRVMSNCPHCNAEVELQSKGGDPCLFTFPIDKIPTDTALDLLENNIWNSVCESCNKAFEFKCEPIPKTVKGWLEKKES